MDAVNAPFVVVSSSNREREWLSACLRKLDPARPVRFAAGMPAEAEDLATDCHLLLLDLDAAASGANATIRALARAAERPIVAFGTSEDDGVIDGALHAGAWAYVPRSYTEGQVLAVLQLALLGTGHRPHAPRRAANDAEDTTPAENAAVIGESKLTRKQVEVLSLAADGLSNKQIGGRLGIAEGTVKLHMSAIYLKLNVERRGEAIVLARRMEEVRAHQMHQAERGEQVLNWLLPHVTHRRARQGEVIFGIGDQSRELYYIQQGRVRLKEIDVEMGAGEVMGEIGLFSPTHTRTCTAVCSTDVELFCLGSEQARSIYYLNPQFALHIVQLIAQRLLADRQRSQ
jgi:DNA-binding NarL/FixJ family response regulator